METIVAKYDKSCPRQRVYGDLVFFRSNEGLAPGSITRGGQVPPPHTSSSSYKLCSLLILVFWGKSVLTFRWKEVQIFVNNTNICN